MNTTNPAYHRRGSFWLCASLSLLVFAAIGCRPAVVKTDAQDQDLFNQSPLPGTYLSDETGKANIIRPGAHWMGKVDAGAGLTFASWRDNDGTRRFCIVVLCEPAKDRLVLMPLETGETP